MSIARRARGKKPKQAELPFRCNACQDVHLMKVDVPMQSSYIKEPCPNKAPSKFQVIMDRIHKNPRRFGL